MGCKSLRHLFKFAELPNLPQARFRSAIEHRRLQHRKLAV